LGEGVEEEKEMMKNGHLFSLYLSIPPLPCYNRRQPVFFMRADDDESVGSVKPEGRRRVRTDLPPISTSSAPIRLRL